jgi:phage tail-like protein
MAVKDDPFGNFYFALELDGNEIAHFVECSGMKVQAEIYEIREGGLNGTVHKRPKGYKWDNIQLRYATSASTKIVEWIDKFFQD